MICKAALDGTYEDRYFACEDQDTTSATTSEPPTRRLRAKIYILNDNFNRIFTAKAHTYTILDSRTKTCASSPVHEGAQTQDLNNGDTAPINGCDKGSGVRNPMEPVEMTRELTLK